MDMYTRNTVVAVRPFTRQREGEEVIIGSAETGVFLAVPPEAVELLEHLAQGKSVGEVSDLYQQSHGEAPDLDDFLSLLQSKGIVEPLVENNGGGSSPSTSRQPARPRYHFSNFPQPLAQRLFSQPVLAGCLLLIALALGAIIRYPSLLPVPRDLYFPDHRALTWTILIAAMYATIFAHELGHLIAARAVGIKSRMGISHRLWYLVAETDLTGLWAVPKRQRFMPMLAGALIDAVSAALLVLLLFAHRQEWLVLPSLWLRLVRAMAFTYLMRIAWQFFLFVRTDLYYVIATLFNCRNLLTDTQVLLRNQMARVIPWIRPMDQSGIPASERRVIRAYAVLWVAGRIWALSVLLMITVPICLNYVRNLAGAFRTGYSANPSDFTDAVVLTTYFLVPLMAGLMLWIGGIVRRERI
jgi:putative peptide zinc metalloprotease protein